MYGLQHPNHQLPSWSKAQDVGKTIGAHEANPKWDSPRVWRSWFSLGAGRSAPTFGNTKAGNESSGGSMTQTSVLEPTSPWLRMYRLLFQVVISSLWPLEIRWCQHKHGKQRLKFHRSLTIPDSLECSSQLAFTLKFNISPGLFLPLLTPHSGRSIHIAAPWRNLGWFPSQIISAMFVRFLGVFTLPTWTGQQCTITPFNIPNYVLDL